MDTDDLIVELKKSLESSSEKERKAWAIIIVEEDLNLETLSNLLYSERNIALRFSWLLSNIGLYNAEKLLSILPELFKKRNQVNIPFFEHKFSKYWSLTGVPKEIEGEAINLLFKWLIHPKTNVSTKTYSLVCLDTLSQKYPEIKGELRACIENQIEFNSNAFRKRAMKILQSLG